MSEESAKEVEGYSFVEMQLVSLGLDELLARVDGGTNSDARYWCWVPNPKTCVLINGHNEIPNVKVSFIVGGYRPTDLIEYFRS